MTVKEDDPVGERMVMKTVEVVCAPLCVAVKSSLFYLNNKSLNKIGVVNVQLKGGYAV